MKDRYHRSALVSIAGVWLCSALALPASDEYWPQWRGPLANGVAPKANPPINWSETNNVQWKVKIPGRGSATPIIWGKQLFVQTAIPTAKSVEAGAENPEPQRRPGRGGGMRSEKPTAPYQFVVLCLEAETGKTIWEKSARQELPHEGHHRDHGFASFSPMTDGKLLWSYFGSRGLYCFDLQGNQKWEKQFGQMQTKNSFGEGSSPAVYGDTIVLTWDHEGEDFIAALDKNTGKELWRQARDEETSWATPLIVEHGGKAQVITAATRKIRSYDLANGKLLWECGGMTANVIPTPVADKEKAYITSGFRGSALFAIKLDAAGDITGTDAIVWSHDKGTPYVPSPMLYGNRLYFFGGNNNILSCFDTKSGKALIEEARVEGLQGVYASPVGAAGRVYLVGRNGAVAVVKNSDKLEVLATNKLDERIDASPALVGDRLYLRGQEHLYCLAAK
jgi:outer membrane protein assembly factor BamB